jgi:hypothetical protein
VDGNVAALALICLEDVPFVFHHLRLETGFELLEVGVADA